MFQEQPQPTAEGGDARAYEEGKVTRGLEGRAGAREEGECFGDGANGVKFDGVGEGGDCSEDGWEGGGKMVGIAGVDAGSGWLGKEFGELSGRKTYSKELSVAEGIGRGYTDVMLSLMFTCFSHFESLEYRMIRLRINLSTRL